MLWMVHDENRWSRPYVGRDFFYFEEGLRGRRWKVIVNIKDDLQRSEPFHVKPHDSNH
ncbi:hypothetical protein D3C86_1991100 [compost metagenome]